MRLKHRRVLLAGSPLLPLGVEVLVAALGGMHDLRNLLWGPIVLVAEAPVVLWLGQGSGSNRDTRRRNRHIHVVPPSHKER